MTGQRSDSPVAAFCAALRRLQQESKLTRAELARRADCSRSQLYQILNGRISRPPDWDRVESLVRACTDNDERQIVVWRRRHGVLVEVHHELRRGQDSAPSPAKVVRVVPAQLPADVDVFTGRAEELADSITFWQVRPIAGQGTRRRW